ncbi:hypothetical protein BDV98DRAFT_39823 [Pterulicium gracile]|uniref:T-cell immunomodulatory protein TIP C2 domain-containing protein n=1 Tax=Pterulicium gracile TaxID=1884261 RepID=A0A5C3R0R3_9AGAR|nr:hypothetical protein BDV98DRAFT_39823 [Pterula gracilis]
MQLLPTSLVALILSYAHPAQAIWPFPPKRFAGNALINAGTMGLDNSSRVVAFGDFDGDQFLDVVSLTDDQQTLQIHFWNHQSFRYQLGPSIRHPHRIHNVVPGDFTHSGRLDLLVMSEGRLNDQLDIVVYPARPSGGFDATNTIDVQSSAKAQPVPFDMDGDMKIDLLGLPGSNSGLLRVWQNSWNASASRPQLFDLVDPAFQSEPRCRLADPHGSSVVDLNGDCLADLFLVCDEGRGAKSFQIWVSEKEKGFKLAQKGALPNGVGAMAFADMDRDGTIDLVFTTCSSVSSSTGQGSGCSINIAYNQQIPICSSSTPMLSASAPLKCRTLENLCTADPDFQFDLTDSKDNDAFASFAIADLFPSHANELLVLDRTYNPPLPLPVKLGDADLDGFPDILLIVAGTPRLLYSTSCDAGGHCKGGRGTRGFQEHSSGTESLAKIKDARGVSWADLDEDGTLDILVQRTGNDKQGTITFIQNNFYYDAFFLKAIVLNGACNNGECSVEEGENTYTYRPFGVSYSGASYKYTVLDTSGRRAAAQVGQLSQTTYHSLLTPYCFFGLGRTNNYIENLFVGTTLHSDEHFVDLEGVIPNSKLVVSPPPPGSGQSWKKEIFLRPGEWIPWVTVTVVVGTALLAVIVFVLHLNEKREDEMERRKLSHHINFDAL